MLSQRMPYLTLILLLVLGLFAFSAHAQDCDANGISDTGELGPFEHFERGRRFDGFSSPDPQRLAGNDTDLFRTSSFMIGFWVYRSDATGEGEIWLSTGDPSRPNQSMHIGFRADHTFTFAFWGNDLNTPAAYPPDGQWHHWACLYNRANNQREIYRDGVLVASDNSQFPCNASGSLTVGGWINGDSSSNGIIDELVVYNHSSPSFAQALSNGTTPPNWYYYYKFDETHHSNSAISEPGVGTAPVLSPQMFSDPSPFDYADDCNTNGIQDECDITNGFSLDCNGNGIPDECDIDSGFSQDTDFNGIPDECDPDCNNNGLPDGFDIANGTSQDFDLNGIPDECESDCDNDGRYDIQQFGPFDGAVSAIDFDFNNGSYRNQGGLGTLISGQPFTIEMWVNRDFSDQSTVHEVVFRLGVGFDNEEIVLGFRDTNQFAFWFGFGNPLYSIRPISIPAAPDGTISRACMIVKISNA